MAENLEKVSTHKSKSALELLDEVNQDFQFPEVLQQEASNVPEEIVDSLAVKTTEPGCQLYCGGFLDGSNVGREGKAYPKFGGFCLETQHHPDSVNQPNFESIVLAPGGAYNSKTVYTFGTTGKRRRD